METPDFIPIDSMIEGGSASASVGSPMPADAAIESSLLSGTVIFFGVVACGMLAWWGKDKIREKLWQLKKDSDVPNFGRNDSSLLQAHD